MYMYIIYVALVFIYIWFNGHINLHNLIKYNNEYSAIKVIRVTSAEWCRQHHRTHVLCVWCARGITVDEWNWFIFLLLKMMFIEIIGFFFLSFFFYQMVPSLQWFQETICTGRRWLVSVSERFICVKKSKVFKIQTIFT